MKWSTTTAHKMELTAFLWLVLKLVQFELSTTKSTLQEDVTKIVLWKKQVIKFQT